VSAQLQQRGSARGAEGVSPCDLRVRCEVNRRDDEQAVARSLRSLRGCSLCLASARDLARELRLKRIEVRSRTEQGCLALRTRLLRLHAQLIRPYRPRGLID
jgi:hypothetical protein